MNGLTFRRQPTPSEAVSGTIDIDVTPVMNVFVILIPFLVSVAVFTQMSIVEFSLPPNVGASLDSSGGKPKLKLTAVITPQYLGITYGEVMLDSIPILDGEYDYGAFSAKLDERRGGVEIKDEIIVAVRDVIRFKHVIKVMDRCREAGFEKIGLSSATENPLEVR